MSRSAAGQRVLDLERGWMVVSPYAQRPGATAQSPTEKATQGHAARTALSGSERSCPPLFHAEYQEIASTERLQPGRLPAPASDPGRRRQPESAPHRREESVVLVRQSGVQPERRPREPGQFVRGGGKVTVYGSHHSNGSNHRSRYC